MCHFIKNTMLAAVILFIIVNMLCRVPVVSAADLDCCISYSNRPLPMKYIRGFTEQKANEVCDIDAVIFHTIRGIRVCSNPKDNWVRRNLHYLSKQLQKISEMTEGTSPAPK
ncbi:C-C motif chemokine 20-like [Protopterus annectens]|uniref:C-C motif chemokine 20-like n=1 Tax=Protopterus annectens TaxID=7888 RepID=UPI001CF93210|nr:C-C motif chemokine 20-like [Protopterus annectens]